MGLTASSRSVKNALRINRFPRSSTAWSVPRLGIGTLSSEHGSRFANYGSCAKRSSVVASDTTSGSRTRWAYRSTVIGTAVWCSVSRMTKARPSYWHDSTPLRGRSSPRHLARSRSRVDVLPGYRSHASSSAPRRSSAVSPTPRATPWLPRDSPRRRTMHRLRGRARRHRRRARSGNARCGPDHHTHRRTAPARVERARADRPRPPRIPTDAAPMTSKLIGRGRLPFRPGEADVPSAEH